MSHIIRLREPWEAGGELTEGGQRALLRRRFNRPTGLLVGDRVWLMAGGLAGVARMTLNDISLDISCDSSGTWGSEIQAHLLPHNVITIELALDDQSSADAQLARIRQDVLASGLIRLEINTHWA